MSASIEQRVELRSGDQYSGTVVSFNTLFQPDSVTDGEAHAFISEHGTLHVNYLCRYQGSGVFGSFAIAGDPSVIVGVLERITRTARQVVNQYAAAQPAADAGTGTEAVE